MIREHVETSHNTGLMLSPTTKLMQEERDVEGVHKGLSLFLYVTNKICNILKKNRKNRKKREKACSSSQKTPSGRCSFRVLL